MYGRLILPLAFLAVGSCLEANPTGGSVSAGSASIAGQGTSALTISQSSHDAIINWQTFSIGSGELTKFIQPSSTSATLNRVLGGETSFINGTLTANGQVYLINGNGIVVGPGGVITTAGFTGSTRDIADSDFLSGNLHFLGSNDAGVQNLGTIDALGGNVVLIGKTVDNQGTITASGAAGLVAGDDVLLAQQNPDGSTITVNPVAAPTAATGKVGVHNSGTITASSAELKAANGNIYALAIQNEGLVQATTVKQQGGRIYLTSDDGTVENAGVLNASATATKGKGGPIVLKSTAGTTIDTGKILARGGKGGKGGQVDISGAQLQFTGTVDLTAAHGTTGDLLLDPTTLNVVTGGSGSISNGQNNSSSTIDPTTVDNALNGASVTLNADNGITISNAIVWNSGNTLSLTTNNSGSTIKINSPITDQDQNAGGLTLHTAAATDVISSSGAISVANFELEQGAWVQLIKDSSNGTVGSGNPIAANLPANSTLPAFTAYQDFEIGANATFLRADGGNGGTAYYGLEDIYGVQGITGFLSSNFTLNGRYVEASGTSTWNGGSGFQPIGSDANQYEGQFDDGTIGDLTINLPSNQDVGLFAAVGGNATISGISVENANITGNNNVGAIAGENYGTITSAFSDGGNVTGSYDIGGLVGYNGAAGNLNGGEIYYATVSGQDSVGGVVGQNDGAVSGLISYATVSGNYNVGGVVGYNTYNGTADDVSFGGSVTGVANGGGTNSDDLGGIAGENDGSITSGNTYEGTTVTGDSDVGGIAGYNTGLIADSFNLGSVTGSTEFADSGGDTYIGGIAGENTGGELYDVISADDVSPFTEEGYGGGIIRTSYNSGTVDGGEYVGGIAGLNDTEALIDTCYNVGTIGHNTASYVGGIVGDNYGTVQYTYNSGPVSGIAGTTAGIVGYDEDYATTQYSYWDVTTSAQAIATNNSGDEASATEIDLDALNVGGTEVGGVYTPGTPSPYDYNNYTANFGSATEVNANGVYEIGTSPDGSGPSWYIIQGQTRPLLAMEYSQNIVTSHQLQLVAINLGTNYYIQNELDLSGTSNPAEIWNSNTGFDPIGLSPTANASTGIPFSGSVDANGQGIESLFIDRPTTSDVGIFGYISAAASLTYFQLVDENITGLDNVGGLVGDNHGTVSQDTSNYGYPPSGIQVTGEGNGIGGLVGTNENGGMVTQDINGAGIVGVAGSTGVGGLVGTNLGVVTQSINQGVVGSGVETDVGGLVGLNEARVDDSYGDDEGTIDGATNVGGLVGANGIAVSEPYQPIVETSYSTSSVTNSGATSGDLIGVNYATARHIYWETDNSGGLPGIGENNDTPDTTDVVGYTRAQLTDARNFAQGASPEFWDFSPQTDSGGGIWGINVYNGSGQVHDGLPVLQWQTPINTEVAVQSGTQTYGSAPIVNVTGEGAPTYTTEVPGGPVIATSGSGNAGTTEQVTVTGTPTDYYYNVEYLNGSIDVTPAPLTVAAESFHIPEGAGTPSFGVTYTTLENGNTPSDLGGTLQFTVTPTLNGKPGTYTITPFGLTSSNYDISFVSGHLVIVPPHTPTIPTGENEPLATVESEIATVQQNFAADAFTGLDPIYFMSFPVTELLSGELAGAIDNELDPGYWIYLSSTSNLPALQRLVTPDTGVVFIDNGRVIVGCPTSGAPVFLASPGTCLPEDAIMALQGILSPRVAHQLQPLIYGH